VPSFLAGRLLRSGVRLGVCSYTAVAHFRRADDRVWTATRLLRSETSMVRAIDSCPPYLGQYLLRRSGDLIDLDMLI
jgi:GT2 family glycosyltransferase